MVVPRSVTIVGGGISGLSAAFHLARRFPSGTGTRITLVEGSSRPGGWVYSERRRVKDTAGNQADMLLESGPRTLRPNSMAMLELINFLNLKSSLLTVPRTAPAASNRFLHIPGTDGLHTIPGTFPSLLASPLAKILVPAVVRDARTSSRIVSSESSKDESVDSFLSRHFGADFAQTFGSALVHGIYATDAHILSVRAAFAVLCRLEERGTGSVVRGAIKGMLSSFGGKQANGSDTTQYDVGDVAQIMKGVSVYSFRDGMQTLTDAMLRHLEEHVNVNIVQGDGVTALKKVDGHFEMTTQSRMQIISSHIVSAMPLAKLHRILANSSGPQSLSPLPHLLANPSSSVTVVNLVFPPSASPIHPEGFGYLIPRPSPDYPTSSLGMLGTVFDSCAMSAQDRYEHPSPAPEHRFTKITVMLGGPYGTPTPAPSSSAFLPALLDALRAHLGRSMPLPQPCLVRVREHKDCIPTPTVGHTARMAELAAAVRERWGPNAAVIGAGVGGVSVGDCVESGRRVALELEM